MALDTGMHCLIVDDSKVVRKFTRRIFENLGCTNLHEAEDGQQALDHCKEEMPKLIMLDWHMPVMNGLEFLKHMRELDGGDKPVVIFCTTENDFSNISDAIASGANEYVFKPFDDAIIAGKLEQLGMM
jgi:two-component system chemotaxis response regulator CheY